jgi:hypothetical protein
LWQDRDGAKTALLSVYLFTPIRFVFADQGFAGRLIDWAARTLSMVIDVVRKPPGQRGFEVHRKRWVVERTSGLADGTSPAGPRLRTRSGSLRGDDPLGRDQSDAAPRRPRQTRRTTAMPHPATSPSYTPLDD